ncbi:MAG: hypothetical protein U0522_00860 [Candidatus Paceibacterota bacterium]
MKKIKEIFGNSSLIFTSFFVVIILLGFSFMSGTRVAQGLVDPDLGVCNAHNVGVGARCDFDSQCPSGAGGAPGVCAGGGAPGCGSGTCQQVAISSPIDMCEMAPPDQCSSDSDCGNTAPYGTQAWTAQSHCTSVASTGFPGCSHMECVSPAGGACTTFTPAPPHPSTEDTISWDTSGASSGVYKMSLVILASPSNGTGDKHQMKVVLGSQISDTSLSGGGQEEMTSITYPLYPQSSNPWTNDSALFDRTEGQNLRGPYNLYINSNEEIVIGIRNYDSCQQVYGPWLLMRVRAPDSTDFPGGPVGQCVGTPPDPSNNTVCPNDTDGVSGDVPWSIVSACTDGKKCEMTCNAPYINQGGVCVLPPAPSCVGTQPPGQVCPGDTNVTQNTPWSVVSSCTQNTKCEVVSAMTETGNVYGWAWSSNIGLISMNSCKDEDHNGFADSGSCGPNSYGVRINNANNDVSTNIPSGPGTITGYAWSPNIGFIKFGGLSGFPSGGGTESVNAELMPDQATIRGWARAFWGDNTSGWDGWLSLAGTSFPSGPTHTDGLAGVTFNKPTAHIVGYAWGGDVLGWVNFSDVTYSVPTNTFNYHLTATPASLSMTQRSSKTTKIGVILDNPVAQEVTLASLVTNNDLLHPLSVSFNGNNKCIPTTPPAPACEKTLTVNAGTLTTPGLYNVRVKATTADLPTKSIDIPVTVTANISGDVSISPTCSSLQSTKSIVVINKPVEWKAQISGGTPPYQYDWVERGVVLSSETTNATEVSFNRSYETTGTKRMSLTIRDSSSGSIPVTCNDAEVLILAKPKTGEF